PQGFRSLAAARGVLPPWSLRRATAAAIISSYTDPGFPIYGVRESIMTRKTPCPAARWVAALAVLGLLTASASAAAIRLARHPDYHNGKVVFSYLGDLWLVNEDGSGPQRLTVHRARDPHPRFSPDGKWIAFSSDRYGNNDVFVIPAAGGKA